MTTEQLRQRFLTYFEQNTSLRSFRGDLLLGGGFVLVGLLLLIFSPVIGSPRTIGAALAFLAGGLYRLYPVLKNQRAWRRTRQIIENGEPVRCVTVQANQEIYQPGVGSRFGLVLFSFEETPDYLERLAELARRMHEVKGTQPADADLRAAAAIIDASEARAVEYRRHKLPASFTGEPPVYAADLLIVRHWLRDGYLNRRVLTCLAEPGETGGIIPVPDWLLEEAWRAAEAQREQAEREQAQQPRPIGFRL